MRELAGFLDYFDQHESRGSSGGGGAENQDFEDVVVVRGQEVQFFVEEFGRER